MTNAFDWQGKPSILSNDHSARVTRAGVSVSHAASLSIRRRTAATGVNPGSIPGLSPTADRQRLTPAERKRRLSGA